jgi:hypothetical protein
MRNSKPSNPSSSQLEAALADPDRNRRINVFDAYSRRRPDMIDLPILRRALHDPEFAVARLAAVSIGKLGPKANEAVDDLIAAATWPWEGGCPQRFCDAIAALVRVSPRDERLVGIVQHALSCSNYGIFKGAVQALAAIGTAEAMETLRWVDLYWGTGRKERLADELVQKTLDRCSRQASSQEQPVFVGHRGALFRRRGSDEYRTSVYCPSCRGPMTSLKGTTPYRCRKCEVRLDFSATQLKDVIRELP